MGTKNNPGKYDCYAKLEPDEPYFLLRGKDPIGWLIVKLWIAMRITMADDLIPAAYGDKLNEAKDTAARMKEWAIAKGTLSPGTITKAWMRKMLANLVYGKVGEQEID